MVLDGVLAEHHCAQGPADEAINDGAPDRGPETRDEKALHKRCDEPEQQAVDDEYPPQPRVAQQLHQSALGVRGVRPMGSGQPDHSAPNDDDWHQWEHGEHFTCCREACVIDQKTRDQRTARSGRGLRT